MKKCVIILLAVLLLPGLSRAEVPLQDWYPHDEFGDYSVETIGDYIYAAECGEMSFGSEPPYRTTVYDLQENALFTVDGVFAQYYDENTHELRSGLEDGGGVVWTGEERGSIIWGIVSDKGEMLIGDLTGASGFCDGYAYYSRKFGIELLDRVLEKLGINTGICGRIDTQGNRMEVIGSAMYAPDEQGYLRVQVLGHPTIGEDGNKFVYFTREGEVAIDYAYEWAYPFVDGAAVVIRDGKHMLIDPRGEQIGDVEWEWTSGFYEMRVFEHPMVPVETESGIRLYNRRGEAVLRPFESVAATALDGAYLICDDFENRLNLVDGEGTIVWADWAENWTSPMDGKTLWIKNDPADAHYYEFDIAKLSYTGRKRLGD